MTIQDTELTDLKDSGKPFALDVEKHHPLLFFVASFISIAIFSCAAVYNEENNFAYDNAMVLVSHFESANFDAEETPRIFNDVSSGKDIYNWLKYVVAPSVFQGTIASYNEITGAHIELYKGSYVNNDSPQFSSYLTRVLQEPTHTETKSLNLIFAHNGTAELDSLNSDHWFTSLTVKVEVRIEYYNSMLQTFGRINYDMQTTNSGRMHLGRNVSVQSGGNKIPSIALSSTTTLFSIAYVVIEILCLLRLHKDTTSSNLWRYFKWRIILLLCPIFATTLGICWITKWMLLYYLATPLPQMTNVPGAVDVPPYEFFIDVVSVILWFTFVLMFLRSYVYLYDAHEVFRIPVRAIYLTAESFGGVYFTFLLLWLGWSCSNYLLLGPNINDFNSVFASIFYTFCMWFGAPYLEEMSPISGIQYAVLMLTFWLIMTPLFVSVVLYAYDASERDDSEEEARNWVCAGTSAVVRDTFFCFAGSPDADPYLAQTFKVKDREELPNEFELERQKNQLEDNQFMLKSSAAGSNKSQCVMVVAFVAFSVLFVVTLVLSFDSPATERTEKFQKSIIEQPFSSYSPFVIDSVTPSLARLPSHCQSKTITQNPLSSYDVKSSTISLHSINNIFSVYDWLLSVVIGQVLNADFDRSLHSMLLTNPPVILRLYRLKVHCNSSIVGKEFYPNVRSTCSTCPTSELDFGGYSDFVSEDDGGFTQFIKLGTVKEMQDQVADLQSKRYIDSLTASLSVSWIQYNGDSGSFISNKVNFMQEASGKISVRSTILNIPAAHTGTGTEPFEVWEIMVMVTGVSLAVYSLLLINNINSGRIAINALTTIDVAIVAGFLALAAIMRHYANYKFIPGWTAGDGSPFAGPRYDIPGPVRSWYSIAGGLAGVNPSPSDFSTKRALRLLQELEDVPQILFEAKLAASVTALLVVVRALTFTSIFPDSIFAKIPRAIQAVRWKLLLLFFFAIILFLSFWLAGLVLVGSTMRSFCKPSASFSSSLMLVTAPWNFLVIDVHEASVRGRIYIILFVVVFLFLLDHLILGIVYSGVRKTRIHEYDDMQKNFLQKYKTKQRKRMTIAANESVVLRWKAFYKLLEFNLTAEKSSDAARYHVKTAFFEGYLKMPFMQVPPQDPKGQIERAMLAADLVRIQQYLTDIYFLKAKMQITNNNIYAIEMHLKAAHKLSKKKAEYIESLESQTKAINDDLEGICDAVAVASMDLGESDVGLQKQLQATLGEKPVRISDRRLKKERNLQHSDVERSRRIREKREKLGKGELSPPSVSAPPQHKAAAVVLAPTPASNSERIIGLEFSDPAAITPMDRRSLVENSDSDTDEEWDNIRQKFGGQRSPTMVIRAASKTHPENVELTLVKPQAQIEVTRGNQAIAIRAKKVRKEKNIPNQEMLSNNIQYVDTGGDFLQKNRLPPRFDGTSSEASAEMNTARRSNSEKPVQPAAIETFDQNKATMQIVEPKQKKKGRKKNSDKEHGIFGASILQYADEEQ